MLRAVYDWMLRMAAHPKAPWWLAILSAAESSVFPIPPDVMLAPMAVTRPDRWRFLALLCTLASTVGGVIGWLIGFALFETVGQWIITTYQLQAQMPRFQALYDEWGVAVVAIAGFTPIPYKLATIASGAFKMNLLAFVLASFASRGARFVMVAFVAAKFGPPVLAVIEKRLALFTLLFLGLAVAGFLVVRFV
jgi:membrane protein YqaA with SNARE-associated domain